MIRKLIFFSYHPLYHKVVIGPTKISNYSKTIRPIMKTVPQLLDEGGMGKAKKHWVLKDRPNNRIISFGSLAALKIKKSKGYQKDQKKPSRLRRYHPMVMKAGIKKFQPRPFRALTMAKLLASPKLRSAWSILR